MSIAPRRRRAVSAATTALVVAVLTGCSTSGSGSAPATTAPASSTGAPVTTAPASPTAPPTTDPVTATPTDTLPVSSSAAPSSTAASTTPAASTSAAPAQPPCRLADLTVTGVPGGAYQGREVGGVLLTNAGSAACALQGYLGAQLTRNGTPIGRAAVPSPGPQRVVVLAVGATAEAQLTAVSTCQAAVSDHATVSVPGDPATAQVAMQLRACSLSIDPITRP